jgi:WD40 repeat protein
LLPEYEPGQAVVGGHPFSSGLDGASRITALAMSADGQTLASMGGLTLIWNVAPSFADSTAIYVDRGTPEWPRLSLSRDGRWLAISGDGWRLVSRDGVRGPRLSLPYGLGYDSSCWPAQVIFSPDGLWIAGTGFGPHIGVFGAADLEQPPESELEPIELLAASCGSSGLAPIASTPRIAFTPDSQALVTETGARYRTSDWQLTKAPQGLPLGHGLNGALTISPDGTPLLSDCSETCEPYPARYPDFSADGNWIVAGGTLTHVRTGNVQVLDASAAVGIFTPNGDVVAAAQDNTLTRYCLSQ